MTPFGKLIPNAMCRGAASLMSFEISDGNKSTGHLRMIRKFVLYSFVFLWGGGCVCAAEEMFSTEREFGPVRFSQEQLLELVDRLRVFAEQQGSSRAESDDTSQTLSLSDGQTTLRISEEISVETLGASPPGTAAAPPAPKAPDRGRTARFQVQLPGLGGRGDESSREVNAAAPAHVVQNKVEAAYRRTDLFELQRIMMEDGCPR